ncbi:MAG TPA: 16S rRNA (adenine(1518)-N(6)/adenine(1519)-N(6))-dimethyltransferase RsmA [Steroidobacteraceae bacterium]|nr:16S rRNA (adenine(1518)-N(6)/adenine(1519)-N(6))-dimethyltransferase RsmA [Steroidobacteraceae bacterium]
MSRPRRRFGQHFLHDPAVIERIVASIGPAGGDHLLEIGPGRGVLTRALLASPLASLDAIEIDRDLVALLQQGFAADARFAVHCADALQVDFRELADRHGARLRLVGNLPYNISTPLLFHIIGQADCIEDLHVMLQREVVARIAASPGSQAYGRLTVMLAPWTDAQRLFDVGPGAFQPPPRVWSALVRLQIRREPRFVVHPQYGAVVAAAFSQRRKTLRNALKRFLTADQIAACGIEPGVRPETVAPEGFNRLAEATGAAIG